MSESDDKAVAYPWCPHCQQLGLVPNGRDVSGAPVGLIAKLAQVMAAVERVAKRGHNDFHNYDYATEADIAASLRKELADRNVMLLPNIDSHERVSVGDKGSVLTTLGMSFTFFDGDTGAQLTRTWMGAGTDKEDKGLYKAMTGGEKYFLLKTFLIPTGDDPEKDTTTDRQRPPAARQSPPRVSSKPGVPPEIIGSPERPVGDPEAHREESERLFPKEAASLPNTADALKAFEAGSRECPTCHRTAIRKGAKQYGGGWFCSARDGGCGAKYREPQSQADPVAEERKALLAKANKLATDLGMSPERVREVWATYCGSATRDTVDPAALSELVAYLELRVEQKAG